MGRRRQGSATRGDFTPCLRPARVGNEVRQRTSMQNSAQGLCGRDCALTSRRSSVPKAARWQACHPPPYLCKVRNGGSRVWIRRPLGETAGSNRLESSKGKPQRGSKAWQELFHEKKTRHVVAPTDLGFWALTHQRDVDTVGAVCQDLSNCSDLQRLFANGIAWGI